MRSNRLRNSLLATCAALTMAGAFAYANSATDGGDSDHAGQMHRHGGHARSALLGTLKQLDLSAEQQQTIHSIFQGSADKRKALRDQQRSTFSALASTMPDNSDYPALIATQKQLASDAIQQMSDTETQIYNVLTPEQKAKVPQLLAERKARWEQRRDLSRQQGKDSATS